MEVEAKLAITRQDRLVLENRLATTFPRRLQQLDTYFTSPEGTSLRLRTTSYEPEGELTPAPDACVTVKHGFVQLDGVRAVIELEPGIFVADSGLWSQALRALGHEVEVVVVKTRTEYGLEDGVTVCIDQVDGLDSDYVEVEVLGPDAVLAGARVERVIASLGLATKVREPRGYRSLVKEKLSR